jgi:cytochrome c556
MRGEIMKRLLIAAVALCAGIGAVSADSDAIAQRQALMKANGKAARAIGDMLKGAPFDLAVVQAGLRTFADAAAKAPALFPDDSKTGGETRALPAIWENKADLDARFAKLGKDAADAMAAITDEASFKADAPAIFKNCGGCHENYRAKQQ